MSAVESLVLLTKHLRFSFTAARRVPSDTALPTYIPEWERLETEHVR